MAVSSGGLPATEAQNVTTNNIVNYLKDHPRNNNTENAFSTTPDQLLIKRTTEMPLGVSTVGAVANKNNGSMAGSAVGARPGPDHSHRLRYAQHSAGVYSSQLQHLEDEDDYIDDDDEEESEDGSHNTFPPGHKKRNSTGNVKSGCCCFAFIKAQCHYCPCGASLAEDVRGLSTLKQYSLKKEEILKEKLLKLLSTFQGSYILSLIYRTGILATQYVPDGSLNYYWYWSKVETFVSYPSSYRG